MNLRTISLGLAILILGVGFVSGAAWQEDPARVLDVEAIVAAAYDAAVAAFDRSAPYSIFADTEMMTLGRTGDWQAAGFEKLSDALHAYSYRWTTHLLRLPTTTGPNDVWQQILRTKFGEVLTTPSTAVVFHVHQGHPAASDDGPGTADMPLKTISRGAELALPGDTIYVREGIYREQVAPPRGGLPGQRITYRAAPGEAVVISAADILDTQWIYVQGGVYKAALDPKLFDEYNPFEIELAQAAPRDDFFVTSIPCYQAGAIIVLTLGQVIVGGELYQEVSSASDSVYHYEKTWKYVSEEASIYVHFPAGYSPNRQRIEISTRRQCFAPYISGLGYITVQGFTMKYAANQHPTLFWSVTENMQAGSLSTSRGHHWIIEDNVITKSKALGLDFANQTLEGRLSRDDIGYHMIRRNVISNNGIIGIMGWGSRGVVIEDNWIVGNNSLIMRSYEMGGLKTHGFDGVIRGNYVIGNYGHGIWLDNNFEGAVVSGNFVYENWDAGIFLEMCNGPALLDNNIIGASRDGTHLPGYGVYAHDAGGFVLSGNLIFDSDSVGFLARTLSSRQIPSKEITLVNNVFYNNRREDISIPFEGQYAWDNFSDFNMFDYPTQLVISTWGEMSPQFSAQMQVMASRMQERLPGESVPVWTGIARAPQEGYVLDLRQWQQVLDWDQHSYSGGLIDLDMDMEAMVLRLTVEGIDNWKGTTWENVRSDFFGNTHGESIWMGPFWDLQEGANSMQLRSLPVHH